ncbi:helix-turn-helix domain-containing protein [Hyphomicrobium sp.]|uniref:helix-turn-helix domain-containing protein n=1 Tax=Hyphomicrobium sp. TaxID=82 RepID=UPI002FDFD934
MRNSNKRTSMKCDADKLSELRTKACLTQEALAGRAHVSPRTIQRAEAGELISLNNIQEIASALGVTANELFAPEALEQPEELVDQDETQTIAVVLRPQLTARSLLDAMSDCEATDLRHMLELTSETSEAVIAFLECLGPSLPELCPGYPDPPEQHPGSGGASGPAQTIIHRIRREGELNEQLKILHSAGIGVYVGTFVDFRTVPRWDPEELCWYTRSNQVPEHVKVAVIRLAPVQQRHLGVRVKDPLPF